jgi:hypothetical protein
MDFDAFSHGQIHSKLWLLDNLEPLLPEKSIITILGGWYNVLGFMMLTRRPTRYLGIHCIDKDPDTEQVANRLNNAWTFQPAIVTHQIGDADTMMGIGFAANCVINCSVEHFETNRWFDRLPPKTLVCIQSSDIQDAEHPWLIKTPFKTLDDLKARFTMSELLFADTYRVQYQDWGYNRYMLIGRV